MQIRLNQTEPPVETGEFLIKLTVSDTRIRNKTYTIDVTLAEPFE